MRVFIVHAHPEPQSFNSAMTREATRALRAAGHAVDLSDLYAMGFNPVSDRRNFVTVHNREYYRQQSEEAYAAAHDGFAPDIQAELDKLFRCDVLILQFPLWWFGLPAILKGWIDRVFASGGRTYGGGKWYDRGVFLGKRAMCSVTIGGEAPIYSEGGLNGPISSLLFPINHGMLYFTGFTVIEPSSCMHRCASTMTSARHISPSIGRVCWGSIRHQQSRIPSLPITMPASS